MNAKLICEIFTPAPFVSLDRWEARFPGCAMRRSTMTFRELVDVPDGPEADRQAAMRHNCQSLIGSVQVWEVPSLLMLDFQHARFAASL